MPAPLTLDYLGFSGQVHFPIHYAARKSLQISEVFPFSTEKSDHLVQFHSSHLAPAFLSEQSPLFLAGILETSEPLPVLSEQIASALRRAQYTDLLIGDYCGCLVTENFIWFWKTNASTTNIFYRRDGSRICWSTDPRPLVGTQDLSRDGLAESCLGRDVFVYQGVEYVTAGTLVRCSATQTTSILFDQIAPEERPFMRITLPELAVEARSALFEATRPLAQAQQKIGLLLSGGIDSAAVAASLVAHGAHVTAYHLQFEHSAADESFYAQAVCHALSLPLVTIAATTGEDYLSDQWRFPHPYAHAGLKWMQLIAEQAQHDGISLLTTGRGGDPAFGPLDSYGLADICSAPIALSVKVQMVSGAISTDWLLPDIVRSLGQSSSLINKRSLASGPQGHYQAPPFLCHRFLSTPLPEPYEQTGFSPHDLALETTIWQAHNLYLVHPYHHRAVQQVARRIPTAYRLVPYRGMRVVKPVLRLAFAGILPPLVLRQKRGGWLSVPSQEYCLKHIPELLSLLGNEQTRLRKLGILDPKALRIVLSSTPLTRTYAKELIATAMTELFLRQFMA